MADVINLAFKISADLAQVQSQLRTIEGNFQQSFSKIGTMAEGVGRQLTAVLSVGAVAAFGKNIVNLAGELTDLNEQTQISVEFLSGFKSQLEEGGSSMAAFAQGVFNLQKNLGNVDDDSDKAAIAIKHLKLNLDDLRNSSTDDFIKKVSDALAKIQNPVERSTVLFNLLGKQAKELGPAFAALAGHFDAIKDKGISGQDVAVLDKFGDSITRLGNIFETVAAGPLAGFAEKLELILKLIGLFPKAAIENLESLKATVKSLNQAVASSTGIDPGKLALMTTEELDRLGAARDTAIAAKVAIDKYVQARKALETLDKSIEFTPPAGGGGKFNLPKKPADNSALKKAADELKRLMDESNKQLFAGIDEAKAKSEAAGKDMIEIFKALNLEGLDPVGKELAAINERFAELIAKAGEVEAITGESMQPYIDKLRELREAALLAADPLRKLKKEWEEMRALELEKMFDQDSAERLDQSLGKVKKEGFGDIESLIRGGAQGISDSLRSVALGTQTLGEAWSNMGLAAVAAIQNTIVELLILKPLLEGLKTSFEDSEDSAAGGIFGAIGGFIGKLFGAGFADGGVVPGPIGAPRLAKVHGGETIFPTHKMAMSRGGDVYVNTIDARGAERGVSQEIQRAIEMSRQQAVRQSVSAVGEERARSNSYARRFGR